MSKQKEIKIRRKKYREPLKKCIKALEIAAAKDIVDHDYGRYQRSKLCCQYGDV